MFGTLAAWHRRSSGSTRIAAAAGCGCWPRSLRSGRNGSVSSHTARPWTRSGSSSRRAGALPGGSTGAPDRYPSRALIVHTLGRARRRAGPGGAAHPAQTRHRLWPPGRHRIPSRLTTSIPTGGTVSYFAAAVARGPDGWVAAEVDLNGVADVEEVADRLREVEADASVSLLFVEADDVYLVILRLDEGEDLRVFGSDSAFSEESRLGALLLGEVEEPALEIDEVTAAPAADAEAGTGTGAPDPDVDPVGDADLLADLGVPSHHLLELCAHEGMLPADVTAAICQTLGCGDGMDELRET